MDLTQTKLFDDGSYHLVGLREFAREVGVSHTAIAKAFDRGELTEDCRQAGKIVYERALEQWRVKHPAGDDAPPAERSTAPSEYSLEQTLLTRAKREKAELELAELRGFMHHADDVRAVMSDMLARFKARIRAIPAGVAPALATESDPAAIMDILTRETNAALQELAEYDPDEFRKKSKRRAAIITEEADQPA
jgi:AcrR family transcriptional regulator